MWHYLWTHAVYHMMRWFPQNNRKKIFVMLSFLTLCLLAPQFYVLFAEHTKRFCGYHLFELLITSIIFTFIVLGFSFLFAVMIPVPREIKIAFHIFGFMCFVESLVLIALTLQAQDCASSTEELYYTSLFVSWLSLVCIIYVIVLLPFWIINEVKKNYVLDPYSRTGVCYEPVKCCTCIWHV